MPIVYINGRFLTQPLSGTQRYAQQLLSAVDARLPQWPDAPDLVALVPSGPRRTANWKNIEVKTVGRTRGHLWEQTELALASRKGWLLNLVSSAPVSHPRQVITLHDAALFDHPKHFSRSYEAVHRLIRPLIAKRSHRVLTVSEFSQRALSRALHVPAEKFTIIPNGADHLLNTSEDITAFERRKLERGKFVLFVGNEAPHKNVQSALAAFHTLGRPDLKFVTVGIGLESVFDEAQVAGDQAICRLRNVGDGELRVLYQNAAMLLFPSRYEGFGIPPVEAMSLGCPVVSSNAAAIPEVVGDAGLMVDPDDIFGLSQAMRRVLSEPELRRTMIEKGKERAKHFTWAEAGGKLESLLRSLNMAAATGGFV